MAVLLENKKISFNYCRICGHTPGKNDEPNYTPLRFWDADDGWIIGTLCRWCWEDVKDAKPEPEDYAYRVTNDVCDEVCTDEDPQDALWDAKFYFF